MDPLHGARDTTRSVAGKSPQVPTPSRGGNPAGSGRGGWFTIPGQPTQASVNGIVVPAAPSTGSIRCNRVILARRSVKLRGAGHSWHSDTGYPVPDRGNADLS